MSSRHQQLVKLAHKLQLKYAFEWPWNSGDQQAIKALVKETLQTAIGNASGNPSSGIMPFVKMLEKDEAAMNINILRKTNMIDLPKISVSPVEAADKYASLPQQIQNFLTNNIEIYPSMYQGKPINYSSVEVMLTYP